jgi:phosphohistidine phosphatase SixA
VKRHPIQTIMGRMAAEQGIDVDKINASTQHRAALTMLVELLDTATMPIIVHTDLVPTAALTLRAYAELIESAAAVIDKTPEMRELRDIVRDVESAHCRRHGGTQ